MSAKQKPKISVAGSLVANGPVVPSASGYYSTSTRPHNGQFPQQQQWTGPVYCQQQNSQAVRHRGGMAPVDQYPAGQSYRDTTIDVPDHIGRHLEYPPIRVCSCTDVAAWSALVLVLALSVLVAIIYFNWRGPLTPPLMVARAEGTLPAGAIWSGSPGDSQRNQLQPSDPRAPDPPPPPQGGPGGGGISLRDTTLMNAMRHMYHNHTRYSHFRLQGTVNEFTRWPARGILDGLEYGKLTSTRLCCHVGTQYFVCDYGQGATSNIALECLVKYDPNEEGSFLMIYIQSEHMKGARCTFTWTTRDQLDRAVLEDTGKKPDVLATPPAGEKEEEEEEK